MGTICLLLMLVIPLNGATKTNDESSFISMQDNVGGSVGIGVSV